MIRTQYYLLFPIFVLGFLLGEQGQVQEITVEGTKSNELQSIEVLDDGIKISTIYLDKEFQ